MAGLKFPYSDYFGRRRRVNIHAVPHIQGDMVADTVGTRPIQTDDVTDVDFRPWNRNPGFDLAIGLSGNGDVKQRLVNVLRKSRAVKTVGRGAARNIADPQT